MELRHDMLAHGVNVVCAQHDGKRGGLTVAWATQVAKNRVLICVGEQSATRELILASQAFGLSVLTTEQVDVARHFGRQSSRTVDKLETIWHHSAETGSPLLDECALTLDCQVEVVHSLDNETLIVGKIIAAEQIAQEYEPLIYCESDY